MAMQFGDFSSLVQLGVGLHLGTALLQMYGEIGLQPMIRSIERLTDVVDDAEHPIDQELRDEFNEVASRFGVFKIRMFVEYKRALIINSVVAGLLVALLTAISFFFNQPISVEWAIPLVALSVLPAPISLFALWFDANRELSPLLKRANHLEDRMIG